GYLAALHSFPTHPSSDLRVRRNEAEALLRVEPFNCPSRHGRSFQICTFSRLVTLTGRTRSSKIETGDELSTGDPDARPCRPADCRWGLYGRPQWEGKAEAPP